MNKTDEHCPDNDRALFRILATSVLVVNRSLGITQVNSAAESLLEQSATKLVGRKLQEVIVGGYEFIQIITRALAEQRSFTERDMTLTPMNMQSIVVDFTVSPWIGGSDTEVWAWIEIASVERHQRIQLVEFMVRQYYIISIIVDINVYMQV